MSESKGNSFVNTNRLTAGRRLCGFGLALALITTAAAHDPYEITSTASLRTNRLDLEIEMEFRTALLFAGVEGARPKEVSPEELLQAKLPQLRELAGHFYEITAGGNRLTARATNVVLAVENHVRFELEYPNRRERPLRFNADGLQALAGHGPYGTTLTVLDMVNQKVLGQSVLFAASPVLDIPNFPIAKPAVVALSPEAVHSPTGGAPEEKTAPTPVIPHANHPPPRPKPAFFAGIFVLATVLFLVWLGWTKNRHPPQA